MKKLFIANALALFSSISAQTQQGSWVVSGKTGLGFNSVKTNYKINSNSYDLTKVSSFTVSPSVGYFVINNLAAGIELSFLSLKTTNYLPSGVYIQPPGEPNIYKTTETSFAVMPNATYYFPTGSPFRPYVGAGVGYNVSKNYFAENNSLKSNGLVWSGKGGFVYFLNSVAALDLGVGYHSIQKKNNIATTTVGTFGGNVGISVFLK